MPFPRSGTLQSVCVFCGSNAGAGEAYAEAALAAVCHVIGVTPRRLLERE
ncbi:MAG: hypothetical protein HYY78_14615 [Betaproteobacteria bacterium]|nr:hypothetical protein [Betaproteobacteria bacterium]